MGAYFAKTLFSVSWCFKNFVSCFEDFVFVLFVLLSWPWAVFLGRVCLDLYPLLALVWL